MDIIKTRYSIEPRDMKKAMDFYLLLETLVSIVKNLLTVLKSLQQMD